jgi:hypothetical protein
MGMGTSQVEPSWPSRLQAVVARCQQDAALHMTGGPCTEQELRHLEDALGRPLPPGYRTFLARLGGGVFYLRHEIFSAHRVMVHDIELVPDVLSFRQWLGVGVPPGLLPFHRAGSRIHALDLDGAPSGRVVVVDSPEPGYPDFVTFLEQVVRDGRD